jgi:hypothetical protein
MPTTIYPAGTSSEIPDAFRDRRSRAVKPGNNRDGSVSAVGDVLNVTRELASKASMMSTPAKRSFANDS